MSVKIDSIKCFCGGCREKVEIRADFEQSFDGGWTATNKIYTYFNCSRHGAVKAEVNGKQYNDPSELFENIIVEKKQ